ncbi:alpha-1,3/1,6-mannosyltransferase ALG2 [Condylostylus longicornis]|uniref:alpha-1,3/1,6-mannosyltransferase ALG2 n=1 Tax=Condylostylus longicornis TaxID=2530218 RepID=UPI00244E4F53|nr:alpha-1,3/1,6-mannosyltransferase ALG2 [Condylostylus longicornis]
MVRVLFMHPDLGIGGAERLVVDAALALQHKGHIVSFLTNHHDKSHCFEETRNGSIRVETVGDWLPRKIFGGLYAFCAYFRMVYAAIYTSLIFSRREKIDIIFCDQISMGIPFLRLAKYKPKIIFYCHFPDQLLSQKGGMIKTAYRTPLNYLEEVTTGRADRVLVNSKFTRNIFRKTFKRLDITPDVLYPSLNTTFFDDTQVKDDEIDLKLSKDAFIYLSINRFERKKNLALAIESFNQLQAVLNPPEWNRCFLIIAGGYDVRVNENIEYFNELEELARELGVANKVIFLKSPSDIEKIYLLKKCSCLIYTPENEHFGIVPLEAMYMTKPVVAANSGGPTETIIHESTGLLCDHNKMAFAKAMIRLIRDRPLLERMGEMGRKRVQQKFSFEAFADKTDCIVMECISQDKIKSS